jgi:hypothetical protein
MELQKHQEQDKQKQAAFESFAQDVATTTNEALKSFASEITQEGYISATAIEAVRQVVLPDLRGYYDFLARGECRR